MERELEVNNPVVTTGPPEHRESTYPPVQASRSSPGLGPPNHAVNESMTDISFSARSRKRRRGGRVYSGCSVCRLRKIKCDQRQPGCINCERSRRYVCDGYKTNPKQSRRPTSPSPDNERQPASPRHVRSISDEVQDFNRYLGHDPGIESLLGPYHEWLPSAAGRTEEEQTQETSRWHQTSQRHPRTYAVENDAGIGHVDFLPTVNALEETSADFNALENIFPLAQSTPTSQNHLASPLRTDSLLDVLLKSSAQTGLSAAVSHPSGASISLEEIPNLTILVNHYRSHVCQLMMPTLAPSHNPWLHIYLPMALQQPSTQAKRCLLHAILAVAAFNKAELSKADGQLFRAQARHFHDNARLMLKDIIGDRFHQKDLLSDAKDKQALLAAALTMTTVEVFSGGIEGKGYESLILGKHIIRLTGGPSWWVSEPARMTLLQIFRCLEIVAQTSGWTWPTASQSMIEEEPGPYTTATTEADSDECTPNTSEIELLCGTPSPKYTLDISFGIAMKTLRCLNKISEMCTVKKTLGDSGSWSTEAASSLRNLESELFDLMDDPDAFSGHDAANSMCQEGISDYVSREVTENHVWAFHYSTAIFFRRALCQGDTSVKPPLADIEGSRGVQKVRPTGQELVSKALEHLENVDSLSSDMAIANTLWPGFIAAVEAVDMDLRHRALIWFARARRHGIGNIAKAKALVMEVWRRVDRQTWVKPERQNLKSELSHVDWRDVMREKGMYIMLT